MPGTAAALLEQLGQPLPASERFGVAPAGNVNAEEGVWECLATGSVIASHVNDPGFWLFKGYFNLTVGETLRTWTVMETLISIMGLLGVLAINAVLH
jgi:Gnt-II system L-idonate transporter